MNSAQCWISRPLLKQFKGDVAMLLQQKRKGQFTCLSTPRLSHLESSKVLQRSTKKPPIIFQSWDGLAQNQRSNLHLTSKLNKSWSTKNQPGINRSISLRPKPSNILVPPRSQLRPWAVATKITHKKLRPCSWAQTVWWVLPFWLLLSQTHRSILWHQEIMNFESWNFCWYEYEQRFQPDNPWKRSGFNHLESLKFQTTNQV